MKLSVGLLLLSISLAFATGYSALQITQSRSREFGFSTGEINSLKRSFREKHAVQNEISSTELFSNDSGFDLIDPRAIIRPAKSLTFNENRLIYQAIRNCDPSKLRETDSLKIKIWISFQCGLQKDLPKDFFEKPPFVFPTGKSYVLLALQSGSKVFQDQDWLKAHLPYLHALELSEITQFLNLDPKRQILSLLSPEALLAMVSGQDWVLGTKNIFVKRTFETNNELVFSKPSLDYLVYDRNDWDQLLAKLSIETSPNLSNQCLNRNDGLCWMKSAKAARLKIQWTIAITFLIALAATLVCIFQIIRQLKNQTLEEERKRFALQALAHEIRTPLSSLVLSSEQMLSYFDNMPSQAKDALLRMSDDIHRLTRVAESSHHYLRSADSKNIISFNFTKISSVNDYLDSILDRFRDQIIIEKLKTDISFKLDPYWIGVCLQNLTQNACIHGRKPVIVKVSQKTQTDTLIFSVSDAGELASQHMKDIFKPFYKKSHSKGLGLGLTIVETVAHAMKSKLTVLSQPTRFELHIQEPQ